MRLAPLFLVAASLTGAAISGALLIDHDGGWNVDRSANGFLFRICEPPSLPSVSCANVVTSRFGSFDIDIGSRRVLVPTSLVGLAYFTAVAIWFAMLGRIPREAVWLWRSTLLIVSCGLGGSLFFMGLMAFRTMGWCPMCVAAHGVSAAIFCITVSWWRSVGRRTDDPKLEGRREARSPSVPAPSIAQPHPRLAVCAVAMACITAVGFWFYYDARTDAQRQWRKLAGLRQAFVALQTDPSFLRREYLAQPVAELPTESAVREDPSPRLVIFTDYDCKACACFELRRRTLVDAAFGGRLRVEFRHLSRPSNGANPTAEAETVGRAMPTGTSSRIARRAWPALPPSFAAEAARLQAGSAGFARMHSLLFQHRKDRPHRDYANLARLAGLDVDRFLADMAGDSVRQRIQRDAALASRLGVTATPALFLNGRRVPDLCVESRVFWQTISSDVLARDAVTGTLANGGAP